MIMNFSLFIFVGAIFVINPSSRISIGFSGLEFIFNSIQSEEGSLKLISDNSID